MAMIQEAQSVEEMTVNERLVHFGLTDEFSAALQSGDSGLAIQVLLFAGYSQVQARQTAEAVLAAPERHGFSQALTN